MKMSLKEVAALTNAKLEGDENAVILAAAGLDEAGPNDISFLENRKYSERVSTSKAGAVFLPDAVHGKIDGGPKNRLYSPQPRWAYAQVLAVLYAERFKPEPAVLSDKADISFEAVIGKNVSVGSFSVIKPRARIGDGARIGAQVYVGTGARIGKDCVIHPQAVIGDYCELGDRVIVHPGAVVGAEGYGYWTDPKTGVHHKIHQVGNVVVEDDCEIHSNATIDRAATGETRIGAGTKIDNLVQVGHNCRTGQNCLIISQVGMAGSTILGRQVTLAGQVGIAGHVTIGDGAIVAAQTGVMSDVPPRAVVFGSPARPHREAMKIQAILSKLPELYDSFKKFKAVLPSKTPEAESAER